ncbi:MAG: CDGSH iron-sulfur domain-containing protein [Pseudomonadota bacterium]|nr:CDGSH iron-sulfur domain-containing protein [Pseudomonadota bacterium]
MSITPVVVTFTPGQQYRLCGCRHCHSRPWAAADCTQPVMVCCTRKSLVWLCSCGGSTDFPYCDGSHNPRQHMSIRQAASELLADLWRRIRRTRP